MTVLWVLWEINSKGKYFSHIITRSKQSSRSDRLKGEELAESITMEWCVGLHMVTVGLWVTVDAFLNVFDKEKQRLCTMTPHVLMTLSFYWALHKPTSGENMLL